jgi:uncharacterized membrane protein YraQ (UPF0718 family)
MHEILHLIYEMAPFLLLGFFLAGLIHAFVPKALYAKYLSASDWRSVVYATLFGIPIPLCSCGVIPTAMSLRKKGASRGATVSFLIATPQTGVDALMATYSLMGLPFAIIRFVSAIVTALFSGIMVNTFASPSTEETQEDSDLTCDCCCHHHHHESHCHPTLWSKFREALRFGFVEMVQDIGKWLIVGLLIAGIITLCVPDNFFTVLQGNTLLSSLGVILLVLPMYLCATSGIPIAVALMLKGLSPGAALVLLMVGPACNMASLIITGKVLGRRTLIIYIVSIILSALIFAYGIDHLLPREWFTSALSHAHAEHHHHAGIIPILSTIIMAGLLIHAAIRKLF